MDNPKTTVLTIGDPHFKEKNISEMRVLIQAVVKLAKQLQPDLIVILGDVLDTHEKINIYALTESDHLHKMLSEISPLVIIVGNHDRVNNQDFLSEYHAFNSYKNWPNVTVADTTKEIFIKSNRFILVPYVYPGRFEEALSKINDPYQCKCIFAHQEFFGAQMGAIKSDIGDKWDLKHPLVVSGHIHDYQVLQENIIYTGTPLQHTYGNEKKKTVSFFTFGHDVAPEHQRIDLKLPRKRKITIKPSELINWEAPENTKVKLVIDGTLEQIQSIKKLKKIIQLKKDGILIKYNIKRVQNVNVDAHTNTKTYLNKLSLLMGTKMEKKLYCKIFNFDPNIFKSKNRRIVIKR